MVLAVVERNGESLLDVQHTEDFIRVAADDRETRIAG